MSFMHKLSPSRMGWLVVCSQKCMWEGMGWATLTVPHKGSNCPLIFRFHFISKHLSIKQLFVGNMLINLLKSVVSLDIYGFQGRKEYFGCPNTVLGRYLTRPPHLFHLSLAVSFLPLSSFLVVCGLIDYIFLTL